MASSGFPQQHKWDRNAFATFVAVGWLFVVMGFAPSVSSRLAGEADYVAPPVLHAHIIAFVGWMVLLTVQVLLVRTGHRAMHRKLGVAGAILIPVMVVTGIGAEIYSQRFYSPHDPDNLRFFIAPLLQMLIFAACAGAAIALRRDSAAHKRLIVLATAMALVAATNRWWGGALNAVFADGFWGMIINNFAGPNLLMALAMAYDLLTRGRVHRVYVVAVPLILATEVLASAIYHLPGWPGVARQLVGI